MCPLLRNRVIHSLRWVLLTKFGAQALRWSITLIVIRVLTEEDYALTALAVMVSELLFVLSHAGLGSAIVQRPHLQQTMLKEILGALVLINAALMILLNLLAPIVADFYEDARLTLVIRVLSLGFLFQILTVIPLALLTREMRFKEISLIELTSSTLPPVFALFLAISGYGYWALIWTNVLRGAVDALLYNVVKPSLYLPSFSLRRSRHLLAFGGVVVATSIVWFIYANVDIAIAGRLWRQDDLGVYVVTLTLCLMPVAKTIPFIRNVAFPAYSSVQLDIPRVRKYFLKSSRLSSLFFYPLFFGLSVTASPLIPVLLGEKWAGVSPAIAIVSLVMPLRVGIEILQPVFFGIGKPKVELYNALLMLSVMSPLFALGANYGVAGLCYSWLFGYPIIFLIVHYRAISVLGMEMSTFWQTIWAPALSAAFMSGVLYVLEISIGHLVVPSLLLIILIVTGIVTYLAIMRGFFNERLVEFVEMLRQRKSESL